MEKWTPKQVAQLIGELGSADCWKQYAKAVLDEDIDGLTFLNISQESLMKLGFRPLHAEAIVNQRDKLQQPPPSGPSSSLPSSLPPAYAGEQRDDSDNSKALKCNAHNRPLEAFCVQDQQLVCLTCMTSQHRGHHCDLIDDVFLREKAGIQDLLTEADQRSKKLIKTSEDVAAMRNQAQLNHDRVLVEIETFFIAVEKKIRERKDELRGELRGVIEEKLRVLTKQEEDLHNAMKELEKVGGNLKQCLETNSAAECLQLRQEMMLQLNDDRPLVQEKPRQRGKRGREGEMKVGEPVSDSIDNVKIEYIADLKSIENTIERVGELVTGDGSVVVASECEARGEGLQTVRAGQTGEFLLVSKNIKGEVVKSSQNPFQVRVTSGNTDEAAEVVRQTEKEGTFKCTYHTKADPIAETLTVSVMVQEGDHIKGSPFTVRVITSPQFLPRYCGVHTVLSQNNRVVRKFRGGGCFNAACLASYSSHDNNGNNHLQSYRVKIISGSNIMMGFANKSIRRNDYNYTSCGFYLRTYDGTLYAQNGDSNKVFLDRPCNEAGTVIECVLDPVKHEIWFGVDGDRPVLAYERVPVDMLFLAIELHDVGTSVELL